MRTMNKIMLIGRLGRAPELRTSADGKNIWGTFSMATSRSKKVDDRWVEQTDWHRVKVFGTQAGLCEQYLTKGSLAAIEGTLQYDSWQNEEGQKRVVASVVADRVHFLDGNRRLESADSGAGSEESAEATP